LLFSFLALFLFSAGWRLLFSSRKKRVGTGELTMEAKRREQYQKIKVEIINCAGNYQIGKPVLEYLRQLGFNVYDVSYDKDTLPKTIVVERTDQDMKNAQILAKAIMQKKKRGFLRLETKIMPEIKKDIDSALFIDASLILGKDFSVYFPELERW